MAGLWWRNYFRKFFGDCKLKKILSILSFTTLLAFNCIVLSQNVVRIDPLSFCSLYLEIAIGDSTIATATGFVVEFKNKPFLITNFHVVSGLDPATNRPLFRRPDKIFIWYHGQVLGTWIPRAEFLYNNNRVHRWFEHPRDSSIDVVALPIQSIDKDVKIYPFDLSLANTDMIPSVAMTVSVIGFPLGLSGPGKFPIWKTGHIATDPDLDYNGQPVFLIDATTRGGMSGSPVIIRSRGGYTLKSGEFREFIIPAITLFLGIYSGRVGNNSTISSEIGTVWRPQVIIEILEGSN